MRCSSSRRTDGAASILPLRSARGQLGGSLDAVLRLQSGAVRDYVAGKGACARTPAEGAAPAEGSGG